MMDDIDKHVTHEQNQPNLAKIDNDAWVSRTARSAYETATAAAENPYVEGAVAITALAIGGKVWSKVKTAGAELAVAAEEVGLAGKKVEENLASRSISKTPLPENFSFQMPMVEQPVHDPFHLERQNRWVPIGDETVKRYRPPVLTHRGQELELKIPEIGMPIIKPKTP